MRATFGPGGRLRGTYVAPPDKSISHRAALFGAMTAEPVRVVNYLDADDTGSTLRAIQALGSVVEQRPGELTVRGVGLRAAGHPDGPIDVGNAGTLMRLLPGWLAGQRSGAWTIDGDASIRRRPVDRVLEPLARMGADVDACDGRYAPFTVRAGPAAGDRVLAAGAFRPDQVLRPAAGAAGRRLDDGCSSRYPAAITPSGCSCGPGSACCAKVTGSPSASQNELGLETLRVPATRPRRPFAIGRRPCSVPGSRLVVEDLGANWTRVGFLRILRRMGAVVLGRSEEDGAPLSADEPIAELDVSAGRLVATTSAPRRFRTPSTSFRSSALWAASPDGTTVVRGAEGAAAQGVRRIDDLGGRAARAGRGDLEAPGPASPRAGLPGGCAAGRIPRPRGPPAGPSSARWRARVGGGRHGGRDGGGRRVLPGVRARPGGVAGRVRGCPRILG
jgi:3-phosphoshikimate 1-carboxyvinyltransferase